MGYACLSVFERHAVSSASGGTPSLRSSELLWWWWWSCDACPRKLRSHCVRNGEKLCADGGLRATKYAFVCCARRGLAGLRSGWSTRGMHCVSVLVKGRLSADDDVTQLSLC